MQRLVKTGALALLAVLLFGSPGIAESKKSARREDVRQEKFNRNVLRAGDMAPDFELPRLDIFLKQEENDRPEIETVRLSSLLNTQPIVLAFSAIHDHPFEPRYRPWRPCTVSTVTGQ